MKKLLLFLVVLVVITGCPPTGVPTSQSKIEKTDTKEERTEDKQKDKREEHKLVVIVTKDKVVIKTDDKVLEAERNQTEEKKEERTDKQEHTESEIVAGTGNGMLFLLIGAGALVAMGILALIWLRMTRLGLGLIGAGMAVGTCGVFFNWIATEGTWVLVILAIGLLGGIAYVLFRLFRGKQVDTALKHIVGGISESTQGKAVRNKIEQLAGKDDQAVRKVVLRVKK